MNNYKATDMNFIKDRFRQMDSNATNAFLQELSEDEKEIYNRMLPVSWLPVQAAMQIDRKALPYLYPETEQTIHRFGNDIAFYDFKGMYRYLIKVLTPRYVISIAAKIWKTFNKRGIAKSEISPNKNQAAFFVENFDDIPADYCEYITGYIQGVIELAGATGVHVTFDSQSKPIFTWHITWF
jgi:hypothetical protein